jgi:hypothetical protein
MSILVQDSVFTERDQEQGVEVISRSEMLLDQGGDYISFLENLYGADQLAGEERLLIDPLERRFALLTRLRHGWDGPKSRAPSRAAIKVLYAACLRPGVDRTSVGASAHADGYVSTEREAGSSWLTSEIYSDRINYFVDTDVEERRWTGSLDIDELAAFLTSGWAQ